jgi:hypothetical protein
MKILNTNNKKYIFPKRQSFIGICAICFNDVYVEYADTKISEIFEFTCSCCGAVATIYPNP